MAWRVLANGAMLDVINGVMPGGRESTFTKIYREGDIIRGELSKGMVDRYDDNEAYVRSLVERVQAVEGEDSEETVYVPVGKPDADAAPPPASDEEAAQRISDLESELGSARASLEHAQAVAGEKTEAVEALEQEVGDLKNLLEASEKAKDEAELTAVDGLVYADLSAEAIAAEVAARGLVPIGTGKDGSILKKDNVKVLEEARATS